jgi:hypothetical protein
MALHDLTPQLRTRLSRLERVVGWFVTVATLLLVAGLAYYIYQVAERKGWFLKKMPYFTFVRNATGLAVGDRVKMMGFDIGEIIDINAQPPEDVYFTVYLQFRVKEPFYGYLWEDSVAKVGAADFLGHRFIEVTKGTNAPATYAEEIKELPTGDLATYAKSNGFFFAHPISVGTNLIIKNGSYITPEAIRELQMANIPSVQIINKSIPTRPPKWMWGERVGKYVPIPKDSKGYWMPADESPALTERLEAVVHTVEAALPDFLGLTNRLVGMLTNADSLLKHSDELVASAKPIVTNFAQISANLSGPKGSLGDWLLPTNISFQLQSTLVSAGGALGSAQTNLNVLSSNILMSLENLASLTSNLNAQVQANGLILSQISGLVTHSDELVQGLKRNWLLKSSFQRQTNPPVQSIVKPRVGGVQ